MTPPAPPRNRTFVNSPWQERAGGGRLKNGVRRPYGYVGPMCTLFFASVSAPGSSAEMFQGISEAFAHALTATVIPPALATLGATAIFVAATYAIVRWIRRDQERARAELERRRQAAAAAGPPDRRAFVRIPARLPVTTVPPLGQGVVLTFETSDVSGGGLSFRSEAPPRLGAKLHLLLDLGESRPPGGAGELEMEAEVVRIQPSRRPADPPLVGVAFKDIATETRETLLHWIAAEEQRELAARHRGRVCSVCERPLADDETSGIHPTCRTTPSTRPSRPSTTSRPPEIVHMVTSTRPPRTSTRPSQIVTLRPR